MTYKKIISAIFVGLLLLGGQSVMAAGKEKPTQTLRDVIDINEQTIVALQADIKGKIVGKCLGMHAKKDRTNCLKVTLIGKLLKATKQASKSVSISGPADLHKGRGSRAIKKSRKAYRKGESAKALKLAQEALVHYKKAKASHIM